LFGEIFVACHTVDCRKVGMQVGGQLH
jgi:hypothetical protein